MNNDQLSQRIAELQKLAEEATPGPWKYTKNLEWVWPQTQVKSDAVNRSIVNFVDGEPQFSCTIGKAEREWANAAYIAAAHPQAILSLIERIKGLERINTEALTRMDRARDVLTEGNPRPECNWGMLDTSDLRALASAQQQTGVV